MHPANFLFVLAGLGVFLLGFLIRRKKVVGLLTSSESEQTTVRDSLSRFFGAWLMVMGVLLTLTAAVGLIQDAVYSYAYALIIVVIGIRMNMGSAKYGQ